VGEDPDIRVGRTEAAGSRAPWFRLSSLGRPRSATSVLLTRTSATQPGRPLTPDTGRQSGSQDNDPKTGSDRQPVRRQPRLTRLRFLTPDTAFR